MNKILKFIFHERYIGYLLLIWLLKTAVPNFFYENLIKHYWLCDCVSIASYVMMSDLVNFLNFLIDLLSSFTITFYKVLQHWLAYFCLLD